MRTKLAAIRGDRDLRDALEELYAGGGRTYADALDRVHDWSDAWRLLVEACALARLSGDPFSADTIRAAVGRHHKGLAAGRDALQGADRYTRPGDVMAAAVAKELLA